MKNPEKNNQCLMVYSSLLPNMADYVYQYSKALPGELAIIEHNTGERITWKKFNKSVTAFAAALLSMGLNKGDVAVTSLPLTKEHIYLIYACYRIGVIIAPLDLRFNTDEILYCMERIKPKAYFFQGNVHHKDLKPVIKEVMAQSPFVAHWIQLENEEHEIMEGAVSISEYKKRTRKRFFF